jgi:hypothetical protein
MTTEMARERTRTFDVAEELAARRLAGHAAMRARIEQAVEDGDLPATTDAEALGHLVATIAEGVAVQAAGGATQWDPAPATST